MSTLHTITHVHTVRHVHTITCYQGLLYHISDGAQAPFENLGGKGNIQIWGDREKSCRIQIIQYFDAWATRAILAYYVDSEGGWQ